MSDLYITITGFNHYYGILPFNIGTKLLLVRDTDNAYDKSAVAVYCERYGKVGYVANNKETIAEGTSSARSVCEFIAEGRGAEVQFIARDYILARVD